LLRNRSMKGIVKPCVTLVMLLVSLVLMAAIVSASRQEQHVFGQVLPTTSSPSPSVPPAVEWQKTFDFGDYASFVKETSDGGYTIVGGGDTKSGKPKRPIFKLDSSGNMQWSKNFTGTVPSGWLSISEGGYALAIYEDESSNISVVDLSGDVLWTKTYTGGETSAIAHTKDGGYAMASNIEKGYADVSPWTVNDVMLIKTDSFGEIQWDRIYEFSKDDSFIYSVGSLIQTSDGGYALSGCASSERTGKEFLLIKIDSTGNLQWTKLFGGVNDDETETLIQTDDGGYLLAGNTYSYGAGGSDAWLLKTDSSGNPLWTRTYGQAGEVVTLNGGYHDFGTARDVLNDLIVTNDGGFAFVGTSYRDIWVVKTDAVGNQHWNQTYSIEKGQACIGNSLIETNDGKFVIAGEEAPPGFPWYGNYYIIKTESSSPLPSTSPSLGHVPVLEFPSTSIRDDGNIDPPSAPIQRNGNVYTFTGDLKGTLVVNRDDVVIDGAGYSLQGNGTAGDLLIRVSQTGIDLTGQTDVTIKNLLIHSFNTGIYLDCSNYATILGNDIRRNFYGIFDTASAFATILENKITFNEAGIFLSTLSSNSNITLNNIVENVDSGIFLNYTVGNVIFDNNISYNGNGGGIGFSGIESSFCVNTVIVGNVLEGNRYGITIDGSDIIVAGNNVTNSTIGVEVGDIPGHLFYMNNFNNTFINHVRGEGSNSWDNGTVGNYWGDYLTRYPDAKEIDGSGIGDTPYVMVVSYGQIGSPPTLNTNNMDRHPIMAPISNAETSALAQELVLAHSWSPTSSPSGLLSGVDLVLFASLTLAVIVIVAFVVLRHRKK
jgi:parallel beta-helix repeat protein